MHGLRTASVACFGVGLRSAHREEILWQETQPIGAANKQWRSSAMDSDGSDIIVAVYNTNGVYTSWDYGVTWTSRLGAASWDRVASGAGGDGSFLLAAISSGRVYKSANYGVNFSEIQPAGAVDTDCRCLACSADGQYILAGDKGGRLWVSSDYGANWTEQRPAGDANRNWEWGSVSPTGQYMTAGILGGVNGGTLWYSDDYGVNWTEAVPDGAGAERNWTVSLRDDSGARGYAVDNRIGNGTGNAHTAPAMSGPWATRYPCGIADVDWNCGAADTPLKRLLIGHYNGRLCSSNNHGQTWKLEAPLGITTARWETVAVSGDGKRCLAAKWNGRMYVGKWF
jgi:hypothetical protein